MRSVIAFLFSCCLLSTAVAGDYYLQTDGPSPRLPNGFASFCQEHRSDCGAPGRLSLIPKAKWKQTLMSVNTAINNTVRYVKEPFRSDEWKSAGKTGDCEDIAIRKRRELIKSGVPASAMRYGFVENDEGSHIVLVVRTDDGDRILDNTTNAIWPANKIGFRWIAVQSRWNPATWLRVPG